MSSHPKRQKLSQTNDKNNNDTLNNESENGLNSNSKIEEIEEIEEEEIEWKEEEELERKCSICLQRKENEAFGDQCFHSFCFLCIFQWSHMGSTPRCPLCKQEFFSLIHGVKSQSEYKRFFLPSSSLESNERESSLIQFNLNERNRNNQETRWGKSSKIEGIPIQLSSSSNIPFSTIHSLRRAVYLRKLKAIPLVSFGNDKEKKVNQDSNIKPVRIATPPFSCQEFKRRTNYWEEKLHPWLVRELQALLLEEDVELIVNFIMALLQKFEIDDPKCKEELKEFLSDYVEQFSHELVNFANAPYSISVYDKKVEYDYSQAIPSFKKRKEVAEYNQLKNELELIDGKLVKLYQQKKETEEQIKTKREILDKHLKK